MVTTVSEHAVIAMLASAVATLFATMIGGLIWVGRYLTRLHNDMLSVIRDNTAALEKHAGATVNLSEQVKESISHDKAEARRSQDRDKELSDLLIRLDTTLRAKDGNR